MKNELTVLVDEHDDILGYKPRHQLETSDRFRSTAIWLENSQGEVLLAKRHITKQPHPGLWGPAATGTVSHHETFLQNAYRELSEELGMEKVLLAEVHRSPVDHPNGAKRYTVWFKGFTDQPIHDFQLQPSEVSEVSWVSKVWLRNDLAQNPQHYIPSAQLWHDLFL